MKQQLLGSMVISISATVGWLLGSLGLPFNIRAQNQSFAQVSANSNRVLQINFKYNISTAEFKRQMLDNAPRLAAVKGLKWKIWSMDEAKREASGYYLFENEEAMENYLNRVFLVGMGNNPTVSNIVVKKLEILEEPTAITRGPVGKN
jgi:dsDNA-binding SOS-regulon protein